MKTKWKNRIITLDQADLCRRDEVDRLQKEVQILTDLWIEHFPGTHPKEILTPAQINANLESDLAAEDEPEIVRRIREMREKQRRQTAPDAIALFEPTDDEWNQVDALIDEILDQYR